MSRNTEDVKYLTLEQAMEVIAETRAYQTKEWPSLTEPNRPFEEWLVLTDVYLAKLKAIYAETPSYINDGTELNVKGLARIQKYSAIVANLMLWATQSAAGVPQSRGDKPGQTFSRPTPVADFPMSGVDSPQERAELAKRPYTPSDEQFQG